MVKFAFVCAVDMTDSSRSSGSRRRYHGDPNNQAWTKDESTYGKRLMKSMGWEAGTGLGRTGNGRTSHIAVTKKGDKKGIGASLASENWLANADAFSSILAKLNAKHALDKAKDGEADDEPPRVFVPKAKVKKTAAQRAADRRAGSKKIFYSKFVSSKDVNSYADEDLSAIFGRPASSSGASSPSATPTPAATSSPKPELHADASSIPTHTASVSMEDYFKQAMAAKGATLQAAGRQPTVDSFVPPEPVYRHKRGEAKRKRGKAKPEASPAADDVPASKRARGFEAATEAGADTDDEEKDEAKGKEKGKGKKKGKAKDKAKSKNKAKSKDKSKSKSKDKSKSKSKSKSKAKSKSSKHDE